MNPADTARIVAVIETIGARRQISARVDVSGR
jgi:hypothetical protein